MRFNHIQQRDGRWVLVDLIGKGGRIRSVPMPGFAKLRDRTEPKKPHVDINGFLYPCCLLMFGTWFRTAD